MSGRIVERAPVKHRCAPPNTRIPVTGYPQRINPGDVWECDDCGRRWVAEDAPSNHATVGQRTVDAVSWRRESFLRTLLRWWQR